MLLGQGLWVVLVAYACSFLGALQVPVLMTTLTYALVGFIYNVKHCEMGDGADENIVDRNLSILEKCASFWETPAVNSTPHRTTTDVTPGPSSVQNVSETSDANNILDETILNKKKADFKLKALSASEDGESSKKSQSGIYFKALFMACLVTILYKQLLMLCLAFIPIAIYLCNKLFNMFGIKDYAAAYLQEIGQHIQVWLTIQSFCIESILNIGPSMEFTELAGTTTFSTAAALPTRRD